MPFRITIWRPGRLARQTLTATGWQVIRVLLQGTNLVILAHTIGVAGYGTLAGTVALYMLLAQFVGAGTGLTLARDISRNPQLASMQWNAAILVHAITGLLLFAGSWPLVSWLLDSRMEAATCGLFGFAELVIAPAVMPTAYWLLATDRVGWCSCLQTIPALARTCGAAVLLALHTVTLNLYAAIYCGIMAVFVVVALYALTPARGAGWVKVWSNGIAAARDGLSYMLSSLAVTASSELDKTMLLRLAGPVQAGQYAAAFRLAQAATIPVNAFVMSFAPRLFRKSLGLNYYSLVRVYVVAAASYGTLAAAMLWAGAPYLHFLLGPDFDNSAGILRVLCAFVVAACFRQVVSAALTNSDHQRLRNIIEGSGMILFVVLNVFAISSFGWRGAAAVAICGDICIGLAGLFGLYKVSALAEAGAAT